MSSFILPWAELLDAVIAAPEHHQVLYENEHVRVLESRILPGETVKLHTHRWPAAHYFLKTGEFVRRDEHGTLLADSRTSGRTTNDGEIAWSPALGPHSLENVGTTPIHVISVEVKARDVQRMVN